MHLKKTAIFWFVNIVFFFFLVWLFNDLHAVEAVYNARLIRP